MPDRLKALSKIPSIPRLLLVLTVLAEVLRAYPWLILLSSLGIMNWVDPSFSFLSSLIIISAVTVILHFTLSREFRLNEIRITALSIGILSVLLVLRLEIHGGYGFWDFGWFTYVSSHLVSVIAGLLFGTFLIWRGITISRGDLQTDHMYKNFIFGVVGFVLLMIVWASTARINTNEHMFATLVPYILGYFFTSLMSLGISNFLSLRQGMASRPKATELFTRRWLLILLGVVTGIMIVGALLASTFSYNLITWIIQPLDTLASWLLTAFLYVIGYPIGYLVEGIYWAGSYVLAWLMARLNSQEMMQIEMGEIGDKTKEIVTGSFPTTLGAVLQWLLLLVIIGVIIFFLSRAIFRYWRGAQEKGYEEINESLWSWNIFGADVKAFLKSFTDRLRPGGAHLAPPLASTITEPRYIDIREIYRGLLWEGDRYGYPRARSQTPFEYQSYLESRFDSQKVQLTAITNAYVDNRYGQVPPESDEDLTLVRWWLELRAAIRATRAETEAK